MLAAIALIALSSGAQCDVRAPEPHVVSESEARVDERAPTPVEILEVVVSRGRGPAFGCGGITACDELGIISLRVGEPEDDRTAPADMGFQLGLRAGALPEGLVLPQQIKARAGIIDLVWDDGATDRQGRFAFEISVAAVDLAGNFSEFSPGVVVEDGGHFLGEEPEGCTQSSVPGALGALTLGLTLARRRRGQPHPGHTRRLPR